MCRITQLIAVMALVTAVIAPERPIVAQTQQEQDWCTGKKNPPPDLTINGCTVVIQSGKFTGNNLAIAFYDRGNAYGEKGDFDLAIADLDEAIRLDPNYTDAFNLRGLAKREKGDTAGAEADFALASHAATILSGGLQSIALAQNLPSQEKKVIKSVVVKVVTVKAVKKVVIRKETKEVKSPRKFSPTAYKHPHYYVRHVEPMYHRYPLAGCFLFFCPPRYEEHDD